MKQNRPGQQPPLSPPRMLTSSAVSGCGCWGSIHTVSIRFPACFREWQEIDEPPLQRSIRHTHCRMRLWLRIICAFGLSHRHGLEIDGSLWSRHGWNAMQRKTQTWQFLIGNIAIELLISAARESAQINSKRLWWWEEENKQKGGRISVARLPQSRNASYRHMHIATSSTRCFAHAGGSIARRGKIDCSANGQTGQ